MTNEILLGDNAWGELDVLVTSREQFGEVGSISKPRSKPRSVTKHAKVRSLPETSKDLVRAGSQLLAIIRSEGKSALRNELNVKRVAQMLPLHAALGPFSYLFPLQTRLLRRFTRQSFV